MEDGLPVARFWRPPPRGLLDLWGFESHLTHWPFTEMSLRRGHDDVAHAVFTTDALAAGRWTSATGRPSVLTYMGIPDRLGDRRLRRRITRRAVEEVTTTVVLSRAAADALRASLGVEARVIAPGVDVEAFGPGPGRSEQPAILFAAAPEEPRKRIGLLLSAFDLVRRERPTARLLVSRPRSTASVAGLDRPGVELLDLDDRDALVAACRTAWVAALPSEGEAFGLVLTEALACGTPVVAANLGGMREIVDRDSVGRLFDGDDPKALAYTLLEVLELVGDPVTPAACRKRALDFSTARTTDAYVHLYRELLAA